MRWSVPTVGLVALLLAAGCARQPASPASAGGHVIHGRAQSQSGEPVGGAPVRARHAGTNMATVVYTDAGGTFGYAGLPDGSYEVSIRVPGFKDSATQKVTVAAGKATPLEFKLEPNTPPLDEAATGEILAALPGTDEQKDEAARCANCHSLQFVLEAKGRTAKEWLQTIERMRGITPSGAPAPQAVTARVMQDTRAINPLLAEFFAAVAGPDAPQIPRRLLPRPTSHESTEVTITEYHLSRGAVNATFRGDPSGAWLHDVQIDPRTGYAWYTDHFTDVLGRLDSRTGAIKEFPFKHTKADKQAGSHQLNFDRDGNLWLGILWQGTVGRFDMKTEQFTEWTIDEATRFAFVSRAPDGVVWAVSSPTNGLYRLDTATGKFTKFPIPSGKGVYEMQIDSKGMIYFCAMDAGKIGRFDPKTEKFTEWDTPTPASGPRRMEIDAQDRIWFAEFYAGKLGFFDPKTEKIREWALPGMPYPAAYDTAVENRTGAVWINDFNNNRVFRFDPKTETFTEFLMPEEDVEIRHIFVDERTTPATIWIPDYSPPGKLLKLEFPRHASSATH